MKSEDKKNVKELSQCKFSSKLTDAMTPGYQAEFDPEEAERAGAFVEDAISEQDASESDADLIDATVPTVPEA